MRKVLKENSLYLGRTYEQVEESVNNSNLPIIDRLIFMNNVRKIIDAQSMGIDPDKIKQWKDDNHRLMLKSMGIL